MNTQLNNILDRYPNIDFNSDQFELVNLLKEVMNTFGYISKEMQKDISIKINLPLSVIFSVIKRSPHLKEVPTTHKITICTGERCMKKHSYKLLDLCNKKLNFTNNISYDGKWELTTQNCLKNCISSPNIIIDGILYKNVSVETLTKLIDDLSS